MIQISDEYMIASIGGQIVATARRSWHAAADADPVPVRLMGLYQTKGREADATVVVLRNGREVPCARSLAMRPSGGCLPDGLVGLRHRAPPTASSANFLVSALPRTCANGSTRSSDTVDCGRSKYLTDHKFRVTAA